MGIFDNDNERTITFTANVANTHIQFTKTYDDGDPWTVILEDFISFLEAQQFRGVRDRISIADSVYLSDMWTGNVHEWEGEQ